MECKIPRRKNYVHLSIHPSPEIMKEYLRQIFESSMYIIPIPSSQNLIPRPFSEANRKNKIFQTKNTTSVYCFFSIWFQI